MRMIKSLLIGATSLAITMSPIMAQAQQVSNVTATPKIRMNGAQQSGGTAGSEASASSGGMFGLSTMTMVGIGAAFAAIVVVSVTSSDKASPITRDPINEGCAVVQGGCPPPTTTASPAVTSSSTGTGN